MQTCLTASGTHSWGGVRAERWGGSVLVGPTGSCWVADVDCWHAVCYPCLPVVRWRRVGPPVMFVVQGLNVSEGAPDVGRVCSVAGCDPDSLLNQASRRSQPAKQPTCPACQCRRGAAPACWPWQQQQHRRSSVAPPSVSCCAGGAGGACPLVFLAGHPGSLLARRLPDLGLARDTAGKQWQGVRPAYPLQHA